jgi:RNA polymerase sigma-70 factor (ECF subfamily)
LNPERARSAAEAAARHSYGKLVALLAARTHDVAAAEDALAEAFATALTEWPASGVPRKPEAWLLTVARRRMIDAGRRHRVASEGVAHVRLLHEELEAEAASGELPDERLALMFACAHPAIDAAIRAPLILQTLLGFDAAAIGSAFLVSPATMGQRLVRAKRKIREAGIRLSVPEREDLRDRLDPVLEAIYAAFGEGWSDPAGGDARRGNLTEEALWLGRLLVSLLPDEAEALGLLALMLHAEARRPARRDASGAFVPLSSQDPATWDVTLMAEAEALLAHASALPGPTGRFQLEAAVQSAHAARRHLGAPDWPAIVALYDALLDIMGSPVVAVNRAIAVSEVEGAAAGLEALDALDGERRLTDYQPYWAARAELLARVGDPSAADAAYERAIGLERDPAVRSFLTLRRATSSRAGPRGG